MTLTKDVWIKKQIPTYVSEETVGNKRVVVTANTDTCRLDVFFYRADNLLTDFSEFDFPEEEIDIFNDILASAYGQPMTNELVMKLAFKFKRFLYFIKDPVIEIISL